MLPNNKFLISIGSLCIGLLTPSLSSAALMSYAGTLFGNAHSGGMVFHQENNVGDGSPVSIEDAKNFSAADVDGNATTVGFGGVANAQASYEGLKAFASIIVSNPVLIGSNTPYLVDSSSGTINPEGLPTLFSAEGFAQVTDTITLGAEGISYIKLKLGMSGFLDRLAQENTARDSSQSGGVSLAQREIGAEGVMGPGASLYRDHFGFDEPRLISTEIWTNPISVFDRQATYHLELTARAIIDMQLYDSPGDFFGIEGGLYSVTSDFSHTMNILEVHGFDANGNPVNLGNAIGSEGTLYNIAAVQDNQTSIVPEPESLALVLTGLGIMGFVSRRRHP